MSAREVTSGLRKLCLLATLSCSTAVLGQSVVFDGSMGPVGSLSGDMVIPSDRGTQVGGNLFHSFSIFNVLTGESATFTSDFAGATHNVIARVTGGSHSQIDGSLVNAIPGADLWLINPGGIVFGDNATVDVQGSFHASTADYLLLDDGGRFSASLNDASGTILTMGHPGTFGFLSPQAGSIEVGTSAIDVAPGASVTFTAGDISLQGSAVNAPGGQLGLAAIRGTGEIHLGSDGFMLDGFQGGGQVTLDGAQVDVSGDAGGRVFVHAGQFLMTRGAVIDARTRDQAGGGVSLEVGSAELRQASVIDASTLGAGNASDIRVSATDSIRIVEGSRIESSTHGAGNGGSLSVAAGNRIDIAGWDPASGQLSGLFSNSTRFGHSGDIDIQSPTVALSQGGRISASSSFFGDAGNIDINASDQLWVAGESGDALQSGIFSNSTSRGRSGDIDISAGDVTFLDGAHLMAAAGTFGGRNGSDSGSINIAASGNVLFQGAASTGFSSGVYTGTYSGGNSGNITITGRDISLIQGALVARAVGGGNAGEIRIVAGGDFTIDSRVNGIDRIAFISVELVGQGNGGVIAIEAQNVHILNGSELILRNSQSQGGTAGQMTITARDTIYQIGSDDKFSSVFAEGFDRGSSSAQIVYNARNIVIDGGLITVSIVNTEGQAGSIVINGQDSVLITNNSRIGSDSKDATQPGSDIIIDTGRLEISDNSDIFTNTFFDSGGAGNIFINADELIIRDSGLDAGSCFCSSGDAGGIFIDVSGNIYLSGTQGEAGPAGIRSRTLGSGSGGTIDISAEGIYISDGAAIITSSTATVQDFIDVGLPGETPGPAGSILISAETLEMRSGGSIQSAATEAAGGNIALDIGNFIYLTDAAISAEAQGVTPEDDGGNVTITGPTAIVLHHSAIRANANAGNGGNINITTEVLVPSVDSVLDASSQTGVDGQVVIDSPNQAVSSVALLEAPVLDVAGLVQDPCEVDVSGQRSSLTVEGQGGLPPAPDEYRPSPEPAETAAKTHDPELAQAPVPSQCGEAGP